MAIGTPQPSIGPIDPSALIGQATPVVEPRAVSAMAEAFRSGVITADDIMKRASEVSKLREKAEVQSLTEQMSPEAQAARAGARELQTAQNTAALPLVQPTADLQQRQLESALAYQKYPTAKIFDQYAPVLGIAEPMTPDKQVDWSKKASIGTQIAEHIRLQNEAKEKLSNITTEKSADGSVLAAFTKQGLPVDINEVRKLEAQSRSPFSQLQPGAVNTSAVAGTTLPAATVPAAVTPEQRAQAVEQFGVEPQNAATMTGTEFQGLVEPKAPTAPATKPEISGSPTIGQPVPGGVSLGPPKAKDAAERLLPSEGVTGINKLRQANDIAKRLQQRYQDLVASEPNLVGFLQGRIASWAQSKEWNEKVGAFERDAKAILNPAARAVLGETGVLSDKDVARYEGILPTLRDNPKIGNQKLTDLNNDIQQALANNLDTWKRSGYNVSGFEDVFNTSGAAPTRQQTPPGASGGVMQLPSSGRKIVRDANGQYRLVQ